MTVSMAADTIGIRSAILRVSRVWTSTWAGSTSERCGTSSTSSNVSASLSRTSSFLVSFTGAAAAPRARPRAAGRDGAFGLAPRASLPAFWERRGTSVLREATSGDLHPALHSRGPAHRSSPLPRETPAANGCDLNSHGTSCTSSRCRRGRGRCGPPSGPRAVSSGPRRCRPRPRAAAPSGRRSTGPRSGR